MFIYGTSAFLCATYDNANKYTYENIDTNIHTIIFNDENNNTYYDGVLKGTDVKFDLPSQSTKTINIFATGGGGDTSRIAGRIYNCKIYDKSTTPKTLVRDFIPCYRNSDNEIGLYDLVNDMFYTNSGTGTFIAG